MNTILQIAIEPVIGGTVLALVYIAGFCWFHWKRRLVRFRNNLKPGDLVTVLRSDGERVRARIVKRNSAYSFSLEEIDTRGHLLTAVKFIFP